MKFELSRQILDESLNIKFHQNPSSGSRVVHEDGRKDMTKVTDAFRNFVNAPHFFMCVYILQLVDFYLSETTI
jgi:hypothetical protein